MIADISISELLNGVAGRLIKGKRSGWRYFLCFMWLRLTVKTPLYSREEELDSS